MTDLFEQQIVVATEDIDVLGHVNNVVYLKWMQEIALAHSTALGLSLQDYLALNHAMVASEHHVKYRKAALLGETLILRTWLGALSGYSSVRHYLFYRPQDQAIIFQAQTVWICVEISTGRAKRLSPTFSNAYQPLSTDINPTQLIMQ